MNSFHYKNRELYCEDVPLLRLARQYGTPTYVYSLGHIVGSYESLSKELAPVPHMICYAVKTNSNLGVLQALEQAGSSFDIVSGGELQRLLQIGVSPQRIVFAGVGKRADEMRQALAAGIAMFNVESIPEAEMLSAIAESMQVTAPVAPRINPDLEAGAHAYISTGMSTEKFGLEQRRIFDIFDHLADLPGLRPVGLHCHVGSQILDTASHRAVAARLAELTRALRQRGIELQNLNVGGGLGIRYRDENAPGARDFADAVVPLLSELGVRLLVEPGRFLVGNAGVLLTQALFWKETTAKNFLIVDAGMNDLMRPSLYGAHHEILPLRQDPQRPEVVADVVGPICESGDFLARDRKMPRAETGEWLAVCSAGAYGFTMSSNYNSRPRAAEVLVAGSQYHLARQREVFEDLVRGESTWPELAGALQSGRNWARPELGHRKR